MIDILETYDCVVMGGGPAGSTVAALVAEAGLQTLLVERDAFPRPHVGESLMPETYWVFERLGVLETLRKSSYAKKVGVQFVNHTGRESAPFFFRSHDPRASSQTWHVDRAEFDQMLFDNAAAKGATCCDATRVVDVILDGDRAIGVRLKSAAGDTRQIAAQIVVDATGQQTLLASKLGLRTVNPDFRKAAIWGHFRGGYRDEQGGGVKTAILHTAEQKSWFWHIPQSNSVVSVGVVGDSEYLLQGRGAPDQVFAEELENCATLKNWLKDAQPVDSLQVAKEFSYTTSRSAGDGWVLVGDAWGFIDPIYSTGVYFALKSAELAADCVVDALRSGDVSAAVLGRWLPKFTRQTGLLRQLVGAFYSGEFRVGKFIEQYPEHREELVDLLIGRIFDGCQGRIFDDLLPWLEARHSAADEMPS
ncbi:MAG: tryptophan 7-halogenase [Pirellulales bacterium]|nr:tryptophan 7-halogenase [Pirellulales bacterium]